MNKDMIKTWLITIFSVTVLWGVGNVSAVIAAQALGANAIVYTCSLFIGCSFSLLLYAGYGKIAKGIFRSVDIWLYGFVFLLSFIMSFYLFSFISATEATLLQRSSVVVISFISWVFFKKGLKISNIVGVILIFSGIVFICLGLSASIKAYVLIIVLTLPFLQAIRTLLAEHYRPYKFSSEETKNKDKARNIGIIMLLVSTIFLITIALFSLIEYSTQTDVSSLIPNLKEFTNPASIFMGLIVGMLIIAPIRLIEFSAANKIKAENYLALGALSPFATLFWEWATSPITGLSLKEFTRNDVIAGLIILIGGLVIAFSKAKKQIDNDINEYILQTVTDVESVEDSKDIVEKAMTYFNKNRQDVAKALGLPLDVVNIILEQSDVALKKDILKRVERTYRIDISSKDSLTGLLNRSGLMQKLEILIKKKKDFTLFYIDLNKFKPINDTYGHQAGDEALQVVGQRLASFHKNVKTVSRIGGDEYVIILEKNLEILPFTEKLHKKIEEYFTLKSVNMVASISASIGHVKSKDCKQFNAEELLEFADNMMLDLKEESER